MARPRERDELGLTPAEHRIYLLIVENGLRDRAIADATGWTRGSVKEIIHRILEKRRVASRVALVAQHYQQRKKRAS